MLDSDGFDVFERRGHSVRVMSAGQLWLLSPPQPLVERLGREFFRQLPDRPGVYLMCGANEGVLYVGKAKSLRRRLGSYRVANPERLPRRIIRLLHQVTRIEWDECSNEAAAIHREEMLIVALNPKFNAAGKAWPLEGAEHAAWRQKKHAAARMAGIHPSSSLQPALASAKSE
jgi:predicted GIY-YIG superfamily endonuclease